MHDLRLPYGWGILVRYIFCSLGGQMEHQERMPAQEAKGLLSPECLQGGCSHHKALAQEDKQWASKALLKLPGRQNGFLVSVPPFPVKGCGSSRTVSPLHPSSCLVDPNAHPQGSAACASAQPSCGAAVWPWVWLLGKSLEKPHWETLLFPWEPPLRPSALGFAFATEQLCLCLAMHLTDPHQGPTSFLQIFLALTDHMAAPAHWHSGPVNFCIQVLQGCTLVGDTPPCPPCCFPDYLPMVSVIQLPAIAACSVTPVNGGHSGEGIAKLQLSYLSLI